MRPYRTCWVPAPLSAIALTLGLFALLPAAVLAEDRARCEYRHPGHPDWNFLAACSVSETTQGARITTEARVDNGSVFTLVAEGVGDIRSYTVNGQTAAKLDRGGSRCFLTDAAAETICIHPGGAGLAPPPLSEPTPAPTAAVTGLDGVVLGGGDRGFCLLWVSGAAGDGLIDQGACVRRENCAVDAASGALGCLVDFAWDNGRATAMTKVGEETTLDGALAEAGENGCFTDAGAGISFCFSQAKMTPELYPALTAPPAPEPVPLVVAAPAPPVPVSPAGPSAGHCIYLRGEVEVSRWACTESVACEAPLCTVDYALEDGSAVTLDVADGRVMLMNGARTEPVAWRAGAGVRVVRPDAPYIFRFLPEAEPDAD